MEETKNVKTETGEEATEQPVVEATEKSATEATEKPEAKAKEKSGAKAEEKAEAEAAVRNPYTDEDVEEEEFDMETLTELYENSFQPFIEGELVKGKVIAINENNVMIDIGYKSEGIVNINEFNCIDGHPALNVGDEVEVLLETTENNDGQIVLSKEKAEKMKVWDDIEEAYKNDEIIEGRVIDRIKGGLAVDVGVRAFLPGSQVDVRPVRNLDAFKGEKIRVKVIKLNKRRGNIVLSRKEVIEAENNDRRAETLKNISESSVIKGVVKNITEYGAFIDLGGIDGLLHITDMSWGRINHPSELFNVGDEIEVVVLKYDSSTDRVSLGYKQRWPDPWEKATDKYAIDSRVNGKIVSITDYGAFIELEEGVEGLIHVSEMSWSKRVKHPSKLVTVGNEVEAVVLDIDTTSRRISLGLKQIEPNPWILVKERYREGEIIKGRVRNITDFGAFVEIEEGIDGLIHVSDMSWTKRIKHPSELLKKGEEVEATILNIDVDNQRLSLGLKQMSSNSYDAFFITYKVGDIIDVTVARATTFGVFANLGMEDVEGLIHATELDLKKNQNPEEVYSEGMELKAKIVKIEKDERKIALSVRAIKSDEDKKTKDVYMKKKVGSGKATLGDVFAGLLAKEEDASAETAEKPVEKEAKPKAKAKKAKAEVKAEATEDKAEVAEAKTEAKEEAAVAETKAEVKEEAVVAETKAEVKEEATEEKAKADEAEEKSSDK